MPHNDRPRRDVWPVLPPANKLAFDTPARAFLAADGWEERRLGRSTRPADPRLLPLARALFVVFAVVAIALCARLAAKLFVGSVGGVAPVAALVDPRLD